MKFSLAEVVMLIGLALLAITAYNQKKQIEWAKDTIQLQEAAIKKQQELINHQIRYISYFESLNSTLKQNPIFRGPI